MDSDTDQLHASAVAVGGKGVLLLGPSGAGKSDLALRLIDEGAALIADDRVDVTVVDANVSLSPPEALAGLLEVRGIGIVRRPYETKVSLSLVVDLVEPEDVDRLPERLTAAIMGVTVRRIALDPFQASAPAKIRLALGMKVEDMLET